MRDREDVSCALARGFPVQSPHVHTPYYPFTYRAFPFPCTVVVAIPCSRILWPLYGLHRSLRRRGRRSRRVCISEGKRRCRQEPALARARCCIVDTRVSQLGTPGGGLIGDSVAPYRQQQEISPATCCSVQGPERRAYVNCPR